jgi:hypothetical protein
MTDGGRLGHLPRRRLRASVDRHIGVKMHRRAHLAGSKPPRADDLLCCVRGRIRVGGTGCPRLAGRQLWVDAPYP